MEPGKRVYRDGWLDERRSEWDVVVEFEFDIGFGRGILIVEDLFEQDRFIMFPNGIEQLAEAVEQGHGGFGSQMVR